MKDTQNKKKLIQDKSKFIIDVLDYSIKKNIDNNTKKRIINQISKEIEKTGIVESEIIERLEKLEGVVIQGETERTKSSNYKIKHKPTATVELLKKFKYDNDSGLKELVHTPKIENYTLKNFDDDRKKAEETFKKIKNVPYLLYKNIEELIQLMKNEGRECFKKTNKHPYLNKCNKLNKDIANKKYKHITDNGKNLFISYIIQNFKKNYRFDQETSEASQLKTLIINVFNKRAFNKEEKTYEFDMKFNKKIQKNKTFIYSEFSDNFEERAIFFTWIPYIGSFLRQIAEDILKHGNIKGKQDYSTKEKIIKFEIDRKTNDLLGFTEIPFSIFDEKSFILKPKEIFYKEISEKKDTLTGLCDWYIEADFIEGNNKKSYKIQVLPEAENPFIELKNPINGLKHVLTFYE